MFKNVVSVVSVRCIDYVLPNRLIVFIRATRRVKRMIYLTDSPKKLWCTWNSYERFTNTFCVLLNRISKTSAVRGDFNVRRAKCRKYVYRFAIRKKTEPSTAQLHYIHDWNRSNRAYVGHGNLTPILPFPDVHYIAEIG